MSLADSLAQAWENIERACARRQRSSASVSLLAAVKTVEPARIRQAYDLGVRWFGDNRVQEREDKAPALADLDAEWHLLGPLQSNKAARALAHFAVIETVDSAALAARLDRLAQRPTAVLIEVNIGREPQKHGVLPEHAA